MEVKKLTNILITGGTGFTGTHLVLQHLELGDNITIITRQEKALRKTPLRIAYPNIEQRINIVKGDLRNQSLVDQTLIDYQIDRIYHLAGQTIVSKSTQNPNQFYDTNVNGTLSLLEAVRKTALNPEILVVSTDKVYGDAGTLAYQESLPYNPKGIYDCSKAMEDMMALNYQKVYGFRLAVSRAGNIYGPLDFNPRIIPNTILDCIKGIDPKIYTGINNKRDYVYVRDVTTAYKAILDNISKTEGEAFNVGTCIGKTPEEVVLEILEHFPERKAEYVEPKSYMLTEIGDQISDFGKLNVYTGWEPEVNFEAGIKATVYWYKNCYGV